MGRGGHVIAVRGCCCTRSNAIRRDKMKKFMNKLESKLDGSSSSSSARPSGQPARPPQQQYGQPASGYAQPAGPPPGQQQYQQQQLYGQPQYAPQQTFSQPAGPPPGHFGAAPPQPATSARGGEDPFAALRRYDTGKSTSIVMSHLLTHLSTVFLVDDSESSEPSPMTPRHT